MIPSQDEMRSYTTDHLVDHAQHWEKLAQSSRSVWTAVKGQSDDTDYHGPSANQMRAVVDGHHDHAHTVATQLDAAAKDARAAAVVLSGHQRTVLNTVDETADQQGFSVDSGWNVTDKQYSQGSMAQIARIPDAEALQAQLAQQLATFVGQEYQTGVTMSQHSVALGGQDVTGHLPSPTGSVQCFGPDEQHTYCAEKQPDGSLITFPGIPAMAGQWPDAAKVGEGRVSMLDNPVPSPTPPANGSTQWKSGYDPGPAPVIARPDGTLPMPKLQSPTAVINANVPGLPENLKLHDCSPREKLDAAEKVLEGGGMILGGGFGVAGGLPTAAAGAVGEIPTAGADTPITLGGGAMIAGGATAIEQGETRIVDGIDDARNCR